MPNPPKRFDDADFRRFTVPPATPMRTVLELIDTNGEGAALVVDDDQRLLGIVTDGDIRRAILSGTDFARPVSEFLAGKADTTWDRPLTAPFGMAVDSLLRLMAVRLVRHLPLTDDDGRVVGLALRSQLEREPELPLRAVVMAGGLGMRLRPMTNAVPKPMLKVGDKPLIEHIVGTLRRSGVRKVSVTTHYRADKIKRHLGDGSGFGVEVQYTDEHEPLGTAGALRMLAGSRQPLLVINGDILTTVDFRAMLGFHHEQESDLTVGVRTYEVAVPFGVIQSNGTRVRGIVEKKASIFINAGIYVLEPRVLELIPEGRRFDMPELIEALIAADRVVTSFPIHEDWVDIGDIDDYVRASAFDRTRSVPA